MWIGRFPRRSLRKGRCWIFNRLYRIIGKCEHELNQSPNQESAVLSLGFVAQHQEIVILAGVGVLLLLLAIRFLANRG